MPDSKSSDKTPTSDSESAEAKRAKTSGNREESMTESDDDAFGEQSPSSSGTTSLGGESSGGSTRPGPGGVEGEGGNS